MTARDWIIVIAPGVYKAEWGTTRDVATAVGFRTKMEALYVAELFPCPEHDGIPRSFIRRGILTSGK
jgi:hypothetical protein